MDDRAARVELSIDDPTSADAVYCLTSYYRELQESFDHGFDIEAALAADPNELRPPAGLFVVARLDGRPIGCGGLKFHTTVPAYIKRMWISPEARGFGLGRRLLADLEALARAHGDDAVYLETNRTLTEAIQLYRSTGYVEVPAFNDEPYAHHWFRKQLDAGALVVPSRRTVVTALPLKEPARERLATLLGARVIDVRTECDDAALVLSPSASPQLIGRLRATYPGARIVVAELEDWEFDIELTGPVVRLLRGGADAYLVADSLDDLAHKLGAPSPTTAGQEHSMPMELQATADDLDDLVASFLRQATEAPATPDPVDRPR